MPKVIARLNLVASFARTYCRYWHRQFHWKYLLKFSTKYDWNDVDWFHLTFNLQAVRNQTHWKTIVSMVKSFLRNLQKFVASSNIVLYSDISKIFHINFVLHSSCSQTVIYTWILSFIALFIAYEEVYNTEMHRLPLL